MKRILQCILLILCGLRVYSQDSLYTLGGKIKAVNIIEKTDSTLIYTAPTKTKKREIFLHDLYAIKYSNGKKEVVYRQDTSLYFIFTPEEMGYFLEGAYDAKKTFKPIASDIAACFCGITGGFITVTYLFGLPIFAVEIGVNSYFQPRVNWDKYGRAALVNNEFYQTGFMDAAQRKKIFRGLVISGITFFISTAATITILYQRSDEN